MRANQFQEAKDRFKSATCFVKYPISYQTWMTIDDDLKCAALYVNFYPQIILAWQNLKTYYLEDEECVSIIIQYLIKNVDKIKEDPKRFTTGYIYTVAYRSIQGIRRVDGTKNYYDSYQSRWIETADGERDLFDTLEDRVDCFKNTKMQKIIMDMDDNTKALISHLVFGTKISAKIRKKEDEMMDNLRTLFSEFNETEQTDTTRHECMDMESHTVRFGDIYKDDDSIESAVCTMSDGESAVYYGEKQILHGNRQINIVFFGAKKDYVVPLKVAKELVVTDIEMYS